MAVAIDTKTSAEMQRQLAQAEVDCERMIAENLRLLAALTAVVDEPHTWKMRKIARAALDHTNN